ncbi:hypothetical protein H4582DRAFT_2098339 [Lactarius indigo]|nr:hypothetical protein H4582DRAFT_2098339 [Lactarius indigo]
MGCDFALLRVQGRDASALLRGYPAHDRRLPPLGLLRAGRALDVRPADAQRRAKSSRLATHGLLSTIVTGSRLRNYKSKTPAAPTCSHFLSVSPDITSFHPSGVRELTSVFHSVPPSLAKSFSVLYERKQWGHALSGCAMCIQ